MAGLQDFMDGYKPEPTEFESFEGKFHCVIDNLKIDRENKAGTCAVFTYKVIGPNHANRLVWDNCYLSHDNPKAVKAGQGKIHRVAEALGIATNSKEEAYIGEEVLCTFKINGKYQNVDKVERWEGASETTPAPVATESANVTEEVTEW